MDPYVAILTNYASAYNNIRSWGDAFVEHEPVETLPTANFSNLYERETVGDDYVYKLLNPKPVAQPIIDDNAPVTVPEPTITNPWGTTNKPVVTLSEIMVEEQNNLSSKSNTIDVEDFPNAVIGPITVKNAWGTTNKPVVTLSEVIVEQTAEPVTVKNAWGTTDKPVVMLSEVMAQQAEEPVTDKITITTIEPVSSSASVIDYNHVSVKRYIAADHECSLVWKEFTVLNEELASNKESITLVQKIINSLNRWLASYNRWVNAKDDVNDAFIDFDFEKCFADTHNHQEVLEQQGGHCNNMNNVAKGIKTWKIRKYQQILAKLKSKAKGSK